MTLLILLMFLASVRYMYVYKQTCVPTKSKH